MGVADPFCPVLSKIVQEASARVGCTVHAGGTFVTIEGPRFSTKAESAVWRQLGFSIIGMTTAPEVFLAREAEMHYAVMAHVTDYDVWHTDETVSTELVFSRFQNNISLAQRTIAEAVGQIGAMEYACGCESALSSALLTNRDRVPPETVERLGPIVSKYLKA